MALKCDPVLWLILPGTAWPQVVVSLSIKCRQSRTWFRARKTQEGSLGLECTVIRQFLLVPQEGVPVLS